jgi:hypothetical protein
MSIPGNVFEPAEIVTDGGFSGNGPTGSTSTPSGMYNNGTYAVTGGQMRCTNGATGQSYVWVDIPTIAGRTYNMSVDLIAGTSGASCLYAFKQADDSDIVVASGAGTKTSTVTATGALLRFLLSPGTATTGHTAFMDNMSLKLDAATETALVFSHAKSLGIKGIRTDFGGEWVFYGDSSGRYWTGPDNVVNAAQSAGGMDLCFCEVSSPAWAAASASTYPTTQLSAFATCMTAAASRYQGAVDFWEIRNEQNLSGFSAITASGASINSCASAYMTYATAIAAAIRSGNPRAKISSNGLSPSPNTSLGNYLKASDYLAAMYTNGAKGVFDMIGFHPYARPLQPDDPADYNGWQIMEDGIRGAMCAVGEGRKPIFASEFGYTTGGTSSGEQTTEALAGAGVITAMHLAKRMPSPVPTMIAYYSDTDRHAGSFGSSSNEDYYGAYAGTLAEKSPITNGIRYANRVISQG